MLVKRFAHPARLYVSNAGLWSLEFAYCVTFFIVSDVVAVVDDVAFEVIRVVCCCGGC